MQACNKNEMNPSHKHPQKETPTQVFFCEYYIRARILENSCFWLTEPLWTADSDWQNKLIIT